MWRKINLLILLFSSLLSYSQKKETIIIKKQDEIFFYRTGNFTDSLITKNVSDVFYINITGELKKWTEIKLNNATLLKTNDSTRFKLVYTPGMRYRMVYAALAQESASGLSKYQDDKQPLEPQITTDGAATGSSKDIVIELWDTKTNRVLLKNIFIYKEK